MIAENIYTIALHLPEEELERLYIMLSKKIKKTNPRNKRKKHIIITRDEAVEYLLKNVFQKRKN